MTTTNGSTTSTVETLTTEVRVLMARSRRAEGMTLAERRKQQRNGAMYCSARCRQRAYLRRRRAAK